MSRYSFISYDIQHWIILCEYILWNIIMMDMDIVENILLKESFSSLKNSNLSFIN